MRDPLERSEDRAAFDRARTAQVPTPEISRAEEATSARANVLTLPDPRPSFARPGEAPRSDALEPWADLSIRQDLDRRTFMEVRRAGADPTRDHPVSRDRDG